MVSTGELLWPNTTTPSRTTQAVIYLSWSVEVPRLRVRWDPPFQSFSLRLPNRVGTASSLGACKKLAAHNWTAEDGTSSTLSRREDPVDFDAQLGRLRVAVRRPANLDVLPFGDLDSSVERLLLDAGRASEEKIRALPARTETVVVPHLPGGLLQHPADAGLLDALRGIESEKAQDLIACRYLPDHPEASEGRLGELPLELRARLRDLLVTALGAPQAWPQNLDSLDARPGLASGAGLPSLQVPGLERELHDQRPPKDGCDQPALTQSHKELGLEARGLSEDLSARGEEVNPQTLHALGPGEPVRSAVKVRSEALRVLERAPASPHRDREARKATLERALDLNKSRVLLGPAQVVKDYHNPHRDLRHNGNGHRDRSTVRGVGHGVATHRPGNRPRALSTLPKVLVQVESSETTRHTLKVAGTRLQQPIPVLRVPAEAVSQRRRATAP